MSSKVLHIPQLNWNDCYNSLAMAIYGAIQYTCKPYTLEEVLFFTGQGLKINTDNKVCPMDVFGDGVYLKQGLTSLGFDSSFISANLYGFNWSEDAPVKALNMVRESIDRGIPAVSWNLDNYESGLVYGYDDQKRILSIHDINSQQGGELSYDLFGRRGLNGSAIEPEVFVLVLHDNPAIPHLNVTRYTQEQDESYRAVLLHALELNLKHIEGLEPAADNRKNGIAAIDEWTDAVKAGNAHPFFTTYNLLWITSSRKYMVNFFLESSITHCMSIQDNKLQSLMLEASKHFLAGFQAWVALRQLFPFPNGADLKDPCIRNAALNLLLTARNAELSGMEILQNMEKHLK